MPRISKIFLACGFGSGGAERFRSAAIFEVLEAGVDYLLEAVQLGAPVVAHLVEPAIDIIKPRI